MANITQYSPAMLFSRNFPILFKNEYYLMPIFNGRLLASVICNVCVQDIVPTHTKRYKRSHAHNSFHI